MVPMVVASTMVAGNAAHATNYLTVEQAQNLIFPGVRLTPADVNLTPQQARTLGQVSGATVYRNQVKVWKTSNGGYFILDQVPGRDDRITYAVGFNADGSIKGVEVLVCLAEWNQVRGRWREHFYGRKFTRGHLNKVIPNISGSTLSAQHMTDGITRLLAFHALFLAQK